ncbi:unnamed protein product [Echinostoma caproni]|uniref:Rho-GAP domain-containing protein n=1 Tax=Echinostoma caproni TaxID=27848 RepID=A0A183A702_9TREM|nr:unnamed protein product [Echinostoma caproni]
MKVLFRKCGTQHALQELAEEYDEAAPEPILDPNHHNVHLVAGLLKYYLRELPEPVIPFRFYDRLKSTGFRIADGQDLTPLIDILESLPAPNYHLLQYLCQFLYEVAQHEASNRMSIENLASVFAPNILRQADGDLDVEMAVSSILNLTITEFIRQHEHLFRLELVPLQQLQATIPVHPSSHISRTRSRHTISSSDQFSLKDAPSTYPDVLQPTFKVEKDLALIDTNMKGKTLSRPVAREENSSSLEYDDQSDRWELQNGPSVQLNHVSPSIIPVQNRAIPPAQVTSLHLSTPRSERSCLRRMTQPVLSDYDCEDSYSTPTTNTLSSEVIDSTGGSGSLRLFTRDKHLQSSGFISCFDCPINRTFSVGTRSPQSSSKLNGSERSERRPKLPSLWIQGQKDRIHRTSSCNGYSTLPRRDNLMLHREAKRDDVHRDPDAVDAEVPPKPPPFSVTSNDTGILTTSTASDACQTSPLPRPSPPTNYTTTVLWHSQSTHEFDAPSRLRPDDQIRYWRALAVSSRADAASQRARAQAMVGELNRVRCDLNMAELEIGLLRQRLAAAEAELRHHYRLGLVPTSTQPVWTENWNSR